MVLTEEQKPYEFLVRWDKHGNLAGAHIIYRNVVYRDGEPISDQVGLAQPVAVGAQQGFPLADILDQMHTDALARIEALETEVAARDATIEQQQARIAELEARIAMLEGVA